MPKPEGGELGLGERAGGRHGVAQGQHQPVGAGMQDQTNLIGDGALAGGAVGGELEFGWKIEGKKGIVGHGGCGKSVVRVEDCLDNEFLHDFNELRHTRQPKIRFGVNIPD